ncbi:MAG: hypothetical protein A4E63_01206 [Syntrophorhabdus sp. PtaU1.Bin050]|nr:MAG: hypothetical protein A4E63_01206 [Syntrophorhabdus sp. PtaU1.Bin050]
MFDDPWKHRSGGMRCRTCMWFAIKTPYASNSGLTGRPEDEPTKESNTGRCRRHAPTMNGYPVVFVNDWCGDHKVDENKV